MGASLREFDPQQDQNCGSSPSIFRSSTRCSRTTGRGGENHRMENAPWNEWKAGNHLEPCERWRRE